MCRRGLLLPVLHRCSYARVLHVHLPSCTEGDQCKFIPWWFKFIVDLRRDCTRKAVYVCFVSGLFLVRAWLQDLMYAHSYWNDQWCNAPKPRMNKGQFERSLHYRSYVECWMRSGFFHRLNATVRVEQLAVDMNEVIETINLR